VDGASYRRGSLLAALAHGVPVVTTCPRTATAPAWLEPPPELEDRRTARLAPARDASALAAAVADVLDDPVLANELSRGARELSRFFAWEGIARRHAELYARLTEGTARA
jgi:glycosyltransferase involved in cell wall biosynthesis